ncbi:MAG: orotidine-5'-phosphate decarboxylase [Microbacterium ginsengisoli]|uniref:orotidine-5'-phosphate decarboxylase n=1 Tax=Microbacterium TaxID=33882 RepID=UPI000702322E|nr:MULTISPECIES: orotidine-5'-phosphate decarboxylase [unclassified Microbacterium]MBN9197453.1 orotidine-5'-phosphate decarboxylase [Microbacterium ginsengisoli]KQR93136.1 orotidine 5'-phosphate decarboxylase [Microbacterium sp. Leaf351]KQS05473.1 orotidine 5'-phosphate decarboxylase [Microbacterium sp. Leaf347]ODU76408.1 MAG: orotidine 5'-phosphate decarboxylase [Microbacterium sp. SCN 71-21]OJU77359.1 MAG: orotidine 5'-phosphate decarboxylase [Microbacterium sp. 71-23]
MTTFGQRLWQALDTHGPLCVGIDPHESLLQSWGLPVSADGVREFGLRVVDAAAGRVGVVKPQVAFFERFGSRGFAALEDVLAAARAAELIVIADAKRGDIGSTMDGYAAAWLQPGSPLEADAVTLSPYLGPDSLQQTLTFALRHGKGAFVLAATSNPEAEPVQTAVTADAAAEEGERVAARVARDAGWHNVGLPGALGSVGVVIGATVTRSRFGLSDILLAGTPILAPGFGAQGADPAELGRLFGYVSSQVIANESRSVLAVGPDRLAERIAERAALYGARS